MPLIPDGRATGHINLMAVGGPMPTGDWAHRRLQHPPEGAPPVIVHIDPSTTPEPRRKLIFAAFDESGAETITYPADPDQPMVVDAIRHLVRLHEQETRRPAPFRREWISDGTPLVPRWIIPEGAQTDEDPFGRGVFTSESPEALRGLRVAGFARGGVVAFPHEGHVAGRVSAPQKTESDPRCTVVWADDRQETFAADRFHLDEARNAYLFTSGGVQVASVPREGVRYVHGPTKEA